MNKTTQYIFDTITEAGVTISDFSRLTGISRNALHSWRSGGNITDELRLNIAYNWARRIDAARVEGRLPLPFIFRVSERLAKLKKAIIGKPA